MTSEYTASEWAAFFDHTALKPETTPQMIDHLCDEAREFGFFGVCVNTCHLKQVVTRLEGSRSIPLVVVGFPLGAMHTQAKVYETTWAVDNGAQEIDTVVNIGAYLGGDESAVRSDLANVVRAAGHAPVKVILETGFLNQSQVAELTIWSVEAGAKFVKTSTGMGPRGASVEDIKTMKKTLDGMGLAGREVGIKASGGIRTAGFMKDLVAAGATRVGASASVAILHEL